MVERCSCPRWLCDPDDDDDDNDDTIQPVLTSTPANEWILVEQKFKSMLLLISRFISINIMYHIISYAHF